MNIMYQFKTFDYNTQEVKVNPTPLKTWEVLSAALNVLNCEAIEANSGLIHFCDSDCKASIEHIIVALPLHSRWAHLSSGKTYRLVDYFNVEIDPDKEEKFPFTIAYADELTSRRYSTPLTRWCTRFERYA